MHTTCKENNVQPREDPRISPLVRSFQAAILVLDVLSIACIITGTTTIDLNLSRKRSANKVIATMQRHGTTGQESMKKKMQGSEFGFFQPAPVQLIVARWGLSLIHI